MMDPINIFPGCSDKILNHLSIREVGNSNVVSRAWYEAWSSSLRDDNRCNDERLAVAGVYPSLRSSSGGKVTGMKQHVSSTNDEVGCGLQELTRDLGWIPEICIIFGTGKNWIELCRGQSPRLIMSIKRCLPGNCIVVAASGTGVIGPMDGCKLPPRISEDEFQGVSILLARAPRGVEKAAIITLPRGQAGNSIQALCTNARLGRACSRNDRGHHHHTNPTNLAASISTNLSSRVKRRKRRKLTAQDSSTHKRIRAALIQTWLDYLNCGRVYVQEDPLESMRTSHDVINSQFILAHTANDARAITSESRLRGHCFGGLSSCIIGGLVRHAAPCGSLLLTLFGSSHQTISVDGTFDHAFLLANKHQSVHMDNISYLPKHAWGLATMCCAIDPDDDENSFSIHSPEYLPEHDITTPSSKQLTQVPIIGFLANGEITPDGRLVSYTTCLSLLCPVR